MKILILGANGMLGHKLYQTLSPSMDVVGTVRGNYNGLNKYGFYTESSVLPEINVIRDTSLEIAVEQSRPDVIVNCVGIIKQLKEAKEKMLSIEINSLLPHKLYQICDSRGIRLIHISTDCVFSGKKGNYKEADLSDAEDIYGKTKYLGEISEDGAVTIRTSIIGRELESAHGLIEWLIANKNAKVNGYTNAIFSGFPTVHLARIIQDIIINHPKLDGLYHVSADPIDKYQLITLINQKMGLNVNISKYPDFYCDRSLDSSLFREKTDFKPPSWDKMIDEFAEDSRQYEHWRK